MPSKPKALKRRDLPSLAKYIQSDECQNIVLMMGAGVSTSAGIPDFRSPKTGLYSNLARLNLPHPEAVFEINFFRRNPVPFYTLAHELYPGKFRPTLTHSFVRLLVEKGLLLRCFTQNIDTLERRAGVPADKVIEAHGSFATQRCIDCKAPFDDARMKEHILQKKIARCDRCKGLVKPDIVFFGESLPNEFIRAVPQIAQADLLIVLGTSLTVQPFASLAGMANDRCPRVLINLDRVGDFGRQPDDVILLGKCDDIVKDLCRELGWLDELMELWEATADSVDIGDGKAASSKAKPKSKSKEKPRWVKAEDEVEQLTAAIEQSLALNEEKSEEDKLSKPDETADKDEDDASKPAVSSQATEKSGGGGDHKEPTSPTGTPSESKEPKPVQEKL
ncbi:Sir2 family histone deacetylase Hst2 [Coprinopsis cinerea okayama7|uniref:NAD-dependent protein deacetylase n=1 Tax=Coprinopsis cinerea (strain Okayama-7 / 130 / ATCC MYA-4618 / FGSC 9003) TaxID=240176 RepID=A8NQF7_COPC7|nr:Sir2 family histone deacetylase Hst2 [Coprinopsis cinerea okayama7\|eukprot:XP_001835546.2 Sir2 family histone deacetylase Hst2 [Coprinopsis cinerea okayama7\